MYLDAVPATAEHLASMIRLCHFLQIDEFKAAAVSVVAKAITANKKMVIWVGVSFRP